LVTADSPGVSEGKMEEGKKEKKDDCPWSGRAFPLVMERALHAGNV